MSLFYIFLGIILASYRVEQGLELLVLRLRSFGEGFQWSSLMTKIANYEFKVPMF